MNGIWSRIVTLIEKREIKISEHGYDELAAEGITAREIVAGSPKGIILEEYPDYSKGPCVLIILSILSFAALSIPKGFSPIKCFPAFSIAQ